eukprot:1193598-Prymnesium_polylepis.1
MRSDDICSHLCGGAGGRLVWHLIASCVIALGRRRRAPRRRSRVRLALFVVNPPSARLTSLALTLL